MKYKMIILLSIILFSCGGISERDKNFINTEIALHNSTFGLKYKLDSLAGKNLLSDGMTKIDIGYNPAGDPDLTYEKLIEYCKKEKIDPLVFAKTLCDK